MPELISSLVIILLIFGTEKLPELETFLNKSIKGCKRTVNFSEKKQSDTPEAKAIENTYK